MFSEVQPCTSAPDNSLIDRVDHILARNPVQSKPSITKAQAVIRWLLLSGANTRDKVAYDKALKLGEVVNMPDIAIPSFQDPPLARFPSEAPVPQFIRELDTASAAVLTRVTLHGQTRFYSNDEFNGWFFSGDDANTLFSQGKGFGDIMSTMFATNTDLAKYMDCLGDLLVGKSELQTEGELVANCRFKDQKSKLCVIQVRSFTDKAGDMNACACRVIALPVSDYLMDTAVLQTLSKPVTVSPPVTTTKPSSPQKKRPLASAPVADKCDQFSGMPLLHDDLSSMATMWSNMKFPQNGEFDAEISSDAAKKVKLVEPLKQPQQQQPTHFELGAHAADVGLDGHEEFLGWFSTDISKESALPYDSIDLNDFLGLNQ